jgi:F-type H+-transporting ATPase subunit b
MTEHVAHHPTPWDLFWPLPVVPNFLIFAALMVYFLRGPLREFFRTRAERLRDALEAGARARREAESLRSELARDVADLPAAQERLRADLRAAAEQQRRAVVEAGQRAAQRIRADARLLAEQELAAARQALRAEVIDEAIRQAVAIVRTAVRPEDQERFVTEFVGAAGVSE